MKKTVVRIKFVDFWDNFNPKDNFLYGIISQYFDVELSDTPDFLFFSVFGHENLKYDCVKIFYAGENQAPDFNLTDYAIGFEKIVFSDRYLRFPYCYLELNDFHRMEEKHTKNYSSHGKGFCSFVYSNNKADKERDSIFDALNSYRPVSSGGLYRNNVGGPVKDKIEFQGKFKFCIAFENCSHLGYVTEKLVQAFASGAVPIYWGDPSISEMFNEASFINVHRFSSLQEVVNEVKRLDTDDNAYMEMLKTRALVSPENDSSDAAYKRLTEFLIHILSQNPCDAYRYSRAYWAKRYKGNLVSLYKAYDHSFSGIAHYLYKNTLWKWNHNNEFIRKLDRLLKK